jgi:hypothetical protein
MAVWTSLGDNTAVLSQFSRTTFCTQWKLFWDMSVLDVRHGRVLLHRHGVSLMVWDPIADPNADKMQKLPFPRKVKRDIFPNMATPSSTPIHPNLMLLPGMNLFGLSKNTPPTTSSG